jgi:hypothetical protein
MFGKKHNSEIAKELDLTRNQLAGHIAQLKKFGHIAKPRIKPIKKKKSIVDLMDTQNQKNEGKTKARQFIFNAILQSGLHFGNVISLPCKEWFIEKSILSDISNEFRIIAAEIDKSIYKLSGLTLFKNSTLFNSCSLVNCEVSELIYKGSENEFTHLILDYCGGFSRFAKEISFAMTNKILQVGGTMSMTFSARAFGNYGQSILNRYGITKCTNKNKTAFQLFLNSINTLSSAEYELETIFTYKDSEPMLLFIVKRIK